MEQLSIKDALDLMQSDMKLWDRSQKRDNGKGGLMLTLNLPWGIGEHTVTLEGLKNAQAKRNAVGSYGEYIRGLIKERIDDEAVTARAQQAAARREFADSEDRDSVSTDTGLRDTAVQAPALPQTSKAYFKDATSLIGSRETLLAERAAVADRIDGIEHHLAQARRELRVIEAAIEAWGDEDESSETV